MKNKHIKHIVNIVSLILISCCQLCINASFAVDNKNPPVFNEDSNERITNERISFANDLIPIFTKFGCNAGACHGSAAGRGEFKLSLFGGNPQADYAAIVRQIAGRRVNLIHPEKSLVILKPTAQTRHGGGRVLKEDSEHGDEAVQLLHDWIRQGARYETKRHLKSVDITPKKQIITNLKQTIHLKRISTFLRWNNGRCYPMDSLHTRRHIRHQNQSSNSHSKTESAR